MHTHLLHFLSLFYDNKCKTLAYCLVSGRVKSQKGKGCLTIECQQWITFLQDVVLLLLSLEVVSSVVVFLSGVSSDSFIPGVAKAARPISTDDLNTMDDHSSISCSPFLCDCSAVNILPYRVIYKSSWDFWHVAPVNGFCVLPWGRGETICSCQILLFLSKCYGSCRHVTDPNGHTRNITVWVKFNNLWSYLDLHCWVLVVCTTPIAPSFWSSWVAIHGSYIHGKFCIIRCGGTRTGARKFFLRSVTPRVTSL